MDSTPLTFLVPTSEQLGKTLRGLRKQRGLTQQAVATLAGMPQKTVSLLETAAHRCSVETLYRYLAAVEVNLSVAPRPGTPDTPERTAESW